MGIIDIPCTKSSLDLAKECLRKRYRAVRRQAKQGRPDPDRQRCFLNYFLMVFLSTLFVFVFRHGNDSTACRGVGRRKTLIPPFLKLDGTPLRMSTSCCSLDGSRGSSDSRRLGLLGGGSLSGLASFLSGSSLSGSLLGGGLGLVLLLGRGFLVVELHGLAGLAEQPAELVALGLSLAVGALIVRVALLLAEVTEERGATLVLAGRSLGSGGLSSSLLGGLGLSGGGGGGHGLRLDGLHGSLLDGVLELGGSAGDSGGLSRSRSLLLGLLVGRAGNLLEEVTEQRGTLGLGSRALGLLLLLLCLGLLLLLFGRSRSGSLMTSQLSASGQILNIDETYPQ